MFLTGKQYQSSWDVPKGDPPLKKTRNYYHFKGNSWNDPYRASRKVSQFYHKGQTHFEENYDETEFQRQENREAHEIKKDRVLNRRDIARERLYQRKLEREVLQLKSNQRPIIPEDRQPAVATVIKNDPDIVDELTLARSKTFADPEKYNKRNSFNRFNDLPTKQLDLLVFPEIVDKDTEAARAILQRHRDEENKVNVREVWCRNHRDELRQNLHERHNKVIELEKRAGIVKPRINEDPALIQESTIAARSNSPEFSSRGFMESNIPQEELEKEASLGDHFGDEGFARRTIDEDDIEMNPREYVMLSGAGTNLRNPYSEGGAAASVKTSQEFKPKNKGSDGRLSGVHKSDTFVTGTLTVAERQTSSSNGQRVQNGNPRLFNGQPEEFHLDEKDDINLYEMNMETEGRVTSDGPMKIGEVRPNSLQGKRSNSVRSALHQGNQAAGSRTGSRNGLRLGFTRPKTYSCSRRIDRLTKPKEAFVHPNPYAHSDFNGLFIVDFNEAIGNSSYNTNNVGADTSQFLSVTGNMKKARPKSSQLTFPREDPYKMNVTKKKKMRRTSGGKSSMPGSAMTSPVSKLTTPNRPMTSQSRLAMSKTNMRDHLKQYTSPQFVRTCGIMSMSERHTLEVTEEVHEDNSDIVYSMKELDRFDQRNVDYQRRVGFSRVALEEALKFSSGNFRKEDQA